MPAEDIDIYFHFPDGFELFDLDSYPIEPIEPNEPNRPRSAWGLIPPILNYKIPALYNTIDNVPNIRSNVSSPSIKKTNSYDVNLNVAKLKHNKAAVLGKMFVQFENSDSAINFKVDYEIRCSNVPKLVIGHLNFINEPK